MFIIGIGILTLPLLKYAYNSLFSTIALALKHASDTAKHALAPKLLLFSVPSKSNNILSIVTCSNSLFTKLSLMIVLILLTAFNTPFPK